MQRSSYDRPMSPQVVLYERQGCHLCQEAALVMDAIIGSTAYARVDIDTDDELVLRYGFRVPVVAVGGVDRLEAPITAPELRELLADQAAGTPRVR